MAQAKKSKKKNSIFFMISIFLKCFNPDFEKNIGERGVNLKNISSWGHSQVLIQGGAGAPPLRTQIKFFSNYFKLRPQPKNLLSTPVPSPPPLD